jgi:hypothetical protein
MPSLYVINASHAKSIHKYMNTKLRLLKCNANICFYEIYLEQNLSAKYAQINEKEFTCV